VTFLQFYWPANNPQIKNLPILVPQVGMGFSTIEEAWMFWVGYGGLKGFEVRKMYTNK
jgi:hypothetical protein